MPLTRDQVLQKLETMTNNIDKMIATLVMLKEEYEKAGHSRHAEWFESVAILLWQVQDLIKDAFNWL